MVKDSGQAGATLTDEVQSLADLIETDLWDWLDDRTDGDERHFAQLLATKIVERSKR